MKIRGKGIQLVIKKDKILKKQKKLKKQAAKLSKGERRMSRKKVLRHEKGGPNHLISWVRRF